VEVTFKIRPLIDDTTENFDEMKQESRKCQLQEGSIKYDQLSCIDNKTISKGIKQCQCYPWYLPEENTGNLSICDAYGMKCHERTRKNESNIHEIVAQCPDQCKGTKYYMSLSNLRDTISGIKLPFKKDIHINSNIVIYTIYRVNIQISNTLSQ
jgi:hypothetical protein